jgi:negative regulator of flagellin synthesis FlgM
VSSKINDLTTSVTTGQTAPVAPVRDVTTVSNSGPPTPQSGEVHITDTATQLASLEQSLRDSPAVNSAKVSQLQSAIEQGTYKIDPEHIATQLINMERALARLPGGKGK